MFKNHFKIAFRFFRKNRLFSAINVLGLTIGITAFVLLTRYVAYEKSYDEHLSNVDDLYRVTLTNNLGNKGFQTSATNHPTVGPAMLADFPEVEDFTRIVNKSIPLSGTVILSYTNEHGEKVQSDVKDDIIYLANNSIIEMFAIDLYQGNPESALKEPNTIILSQNIAKRFFGNENPIGKQIKLNDGFELKVTGVFEEAPQNTHLPLGMVVSYATLGSDNDWTNSWVWPEFYNYIKLRPGTDPKLIESRFPAFAQKYLSDIMNEHGFEARFALQPVRDIHLKSDLKKEISTNNSEATLYFLMLVAAFIIAIALINFINLSTAKSMERAKEVGLKKVVGASKRMLVWQFLFESLFINFFATLLSVLLVSLCIPSFNALVGLEVLSLGMWAEWEVWMAMLVIFMGGGILAGLYPAFVLSGFVPVDVLKGSFEKTGKGLVLRKALVVTQFAISIALIAGTFIVYNQYSFMQNQDLGFDANHNLVLRAPIYTDSTIQGKVETFKNELEQSPKINSVTLSNEIPGRAIEWENGVRKPQEGKELAVGSKFLSVDNDFLTTYDIRLLAGRDFVEGDATFYYDDDGPVRQGHRAILNNSAAKILGFNKPEMALNQKIVYQFGPMDRTAEVVGVVEDHHQQSLQQAYSPIILLYFDGYNYASYMTVNIAGNVHESMNEIKAKYKEFFPDDLYNHFFVDEHFNRQYEADIKFGKVCLLFSILAILIAALGLFGLGSYMAVQKTKEISIRKVLGASVGQALVIIPKTLLSLVLISGAIALPIIYFITKKWLEGYAFKIEMGIWMFAVPLLIVMLVALLSIISQSLRTAMVNPADTLRSE